MVSLPYPALSYTGSRIIPTILTSLLLLPHLTTSQSVYTTIIITVAAPLPTDAPSFTDHETFTSAILNSTNFYRESYNASTVRWNSTLESFASNYLNTHTPSSKLKRGNEGGSGKDSSLDGEVKRDGKTCHMAHSGGPYGENLAIGCSDAGSCVDMWASEVSGYDYGDPGFGESTGHFTQLVWRDTTDVGCGAVMCPGNGGWYLACEYWPRGNIIGAFGDEVGEKVSGAPALGSLGLGLGLGGKGWGVVDLVVLLAVALAWWGLV
ncbi:PR-1-like protein [Annulohypoxylon maeteangense]|uniref:PR-1-like protein n=1 Tax=Annulohypoxylon maeteangense TaxID=1927788 RepID=UPI00200737F5|nr:PR-1-like protein [Annulohypoxylon maeteangense]KAI0881603.1 PR-1-like protein [Annulohypoxylon maeteangense]